MQKNNWKTCKLGDVAEITSSKRIFLADYVKEGVPFYRSKEIIERSSGKSITTPLFISEEKYEQIINKYGAPLAGDLLLTSVGTLGIPYRVSPTDKFYFKDGNLTWFRKLDNISCDYLYYFFLSPIGKEKLALIAIGSTQKALTIKALQSVTLSLPPLEEQKRIAEVLGTCDDKIELLQKQNKTLEDMAKAIFKSWFVDFDVVKAKQRGDSKADIMREYHLTEELYALFPSSFEDSSLGPIPAGWGISDLASLCLRCQSGGTPSTKHIEYWANGTIDWFSTKELQDSFLLNSEKTINANGLNSSSAKLFPKGTIIMAIYASPTVGRLGILTKEATFNQAAIGFIPNEEKISGEYLFLMLKYRRDDLNNLANGAAQQNLSVGVVKAFNILIPNTTLNAVYKRIVSPLFNKMKFNAKQIQTLTELRDSLLPRLISGKIRV